MTTRVSKTEREEAIDKLREMLKPGDTVYTVLRHVSRSGMMRAIDLYVYQDNEPRRITWLVCKAAGYPYNETHKALRADGCGMDMGFSVVYSLSSTLYRDGFDCIGEGNYETGRRGCPANDHSNDRGERNYSPDRHHRDGGYAINHRWQ